MTRDGRSVRIICTDRKHGEDELPVVFLEECSNGGEFLLSCKSDGTSDEHYATQYDLFFADEDDEFKTTMISFSHAMFDHLLDTNVKVDIKEWKNKLLDLARKELLKDLPKWKKADSNPPKVQYNLQGKRLYKDGEYYIELSDLETLPKEEYL